MENCYWEKLKGSSNNPNLPVLETMQQFTLNAIAASGNEAMTDSQKWALNHFFYQIGAISNSGIFPKLELLCLPFIGGTKNGALTDFAKGLTADAINDSVTFANGGFVASAASTYISIYTLQTNPDGNYFVFIAGQKDAPATFNIPGNKSGEIKYTVEMSSSRCSIDVSPYTTYASLIQSSAIQNIRGCSFNIANGVGTIYAFNDEIQKLTTTYKSSEDNATLLKVVPRTGTTNNAPFAYALGTGLTEEQQLVFTRAIKDLMDAFA